MTVGDDRYAGYFNERGSGVGDDLTPRELEILAYYSRGLTFAQVADALALSIATVSANGKTAQLKLRAKNTTHACCEALRRGLIR